METQELINRLLKTKGRALERKERVLAFLQDKLSTQPSISGASSLKLETGVEELESWLRAGLLPGKHTSDQLMTLAFIAYPEYLKFNYSKGAYKGGQYVNFGGRLFPSKELNIDNLYVGENLRGKGLGKALVKTLEELATDNNCVRVVAAQVESLTASNFWAHLGYVRGDMNITEGWDYVKDLSRQPALK